MIVLVVGLSATVAGKVGASSILDVFARVQDQNPGIGSSKGSFGSGERGPGSGRDD